MNPPVPQFLWDLITGGAPVNEYSLIGFNMLITGYSLFIFLGLYIIYFIYKIHMLIKNHGVCK
jgi:ABC-type uncharacterized transport system permease subunit